MQFVHTSALLLALASPVLAQGTPVISEFMAANNITIVDENSDSSDWIEIHNPTANAFDLGGWHLTDDASRPKKWTFPKPTLLPSLASIVVFASAKNRTVVNRQLHTSFKLDDAGEYLGLADATGTIVSDHGAKYPPQVTDVSYGFEFNPGPTGKRVYFDAATPGRANGLGAPVFAAVTHSPIPLGASTDCVVTATLLNPNQTVVNSVSLIYRVGFGNESLLAMRDDGKAPDVVANDGRWTAAISNSRFNSGEMLRWRVQASIQGRSDAKAPLFKSTANSPEYLGTMVEDPGINATIPVMHWWTADPTGSESPRGARCSVFFRGEFYDNVFVRNRGGSSQGYPKQSHKFDFNTGNHFRFDPNVGRAEEINLNTTWADKAYMRQILAYETFRDAGAEYSMTLPIRQHRNGSFYMVSIFTEQVDKDYLARQGLDPDGALYKVYNTLTNASTAQNEKKTRRYENWADLQALVNGLQLSGTARERFLWDNIDLPACINHWACIVLVHDNDSVHKNYYVYRDTNGDQEWRLLPWDKDLVLGRNYTLNGGVLNDEMWFNRDPQSHPLYGDSTHRKVDGFYNQLVDSLLGVPRIRSMYLRRLRTLMDELLDEPTTPANQRHYDRRVLALRSYMASDVAVDAPRWIPTYGARQTFDQAVGILKDTYFGGRRAHLFGTHSGATGIIPGKQPAFGLSFAIGQVEFSPPSNNFDEQFVEIVNCDNIAVDMSNWRLRGSGIEFQFIPGTTLDANSSIYVSAAPRAFRARSISPKGGEGRFVVGPFTGRLQSDLGLVLYDQRDQPVTRTGEYNYTLTTTGNGGALISISGAAPNTRLFNLFSLDNRGAPGCGPFLGLGNDVLAQLGLPLNTHPVHVLSDARGDYRFLTPDNSVLKGITLTSRSVYLDARLSVVVSQVRRTSF